MKVLPPTPIMARTFTNIAIPECFEGPGLHSNRYGHIEGSTGCSAHRHNRNRGTIESTLQSPQANSLMARAIISSGHTRSKITLSIPIGVRGHFQGRLALSNTSDHRNKSMARGLPGHGNRGLKQHLSLSGIPQALPAGVKPAATMHCVHVLRTQETQGEPSSAGPGEGSFTANTPMGACTHHQQLTSWLESRRSFRPFSTLLSRGGTLRRSEDCLRFANQEPQ